FSLMEVMFAVAILAVGLVFVACQFPVGLFASRDVADQTRNVIEAHNGRATLQTRLSTIKMDLPIPTASTTTLRTPALDNRPNVYGETNWDVTAVHRLITPNLLADPVVGNRWRVVLDGIVPADDFDYFRYLVDVKGILAPQWPFWSDPTVFPPSVVPFTEATIDVISDLGYVGDIGFMMSPPVDAGDPEVQRLIRQRAGGSYDPTNMSDRRRYLHPAILEVSLRRRYCWAAFYREGSGRFHRGGATAEYFQEPAREFYIFTLRNAPKEVRYAVQSPQSYVIEQANAGDPYRFPSVLPEPGPADQDRLFPVPWRVCLGPSHWQRYRIDPATHEPYEDDPAGPREFEIHPVIASLLRPGSILIDADPADDGDVGAGAMTTTESGQIYEVQEVVRINDVNQDRFSLRLRRGLLDDLHYFWVFPPPILSDRNEFDDWQPVISLTKKMIDY
ncbi:MAG: hypothetical protein JW810_06535, partial [Sedimentisphaerales bacterium]|nr:hypothetical protein [Sedimentisphaerales bacterium]